MKRNPTLKILHHNSSTKTLHQSKYKQTKNKSKKHVFMHIPIFNNYNNFTTTTSFWDNIIIIIFLSLQLLLEIVPFQKLSLFELKFIWCILKFLGHPKIMKRPAINFDSQPTTCDEEGEELTKPCQRNTLNPDYQQMHQGIANIRMKNAKKKKVS